MNKPVPLEDFEFAEVSGVLGQTSRTAAEIEAARLASYETGYSAGWDDALQGVDEDKDRIDAAFARNLEDLGFTFHEARSHVLGSLEPMLNALVETLLPEVLQDTLIHVVNEEIMPLAAEAADRPIELRVSSKSRSVLDPLMIRVPTSPLEIREDDTLPDGQVFLRSATAERCIDFSAALSRIRDAVAALYDINDKAFEHG
ncbi:flagellar biosynthesis protein [Aliiroseovarius sp. 2305UL8-7]|uniref:flagellar biosynthesis protein n=1 Tax=Aliiroseovarius conchicola TaxID=3121637 RepID=UPI003527FA71